MRAMLGLSVLVVLAGCAQHKTAWAKPGATPQDFNMDQGQCRAQGFGSGMNLMQVTLVYTNCMQGKGWYTEEIE